MKSYRKNMFGFVHHSVLGLAVIGVVALVGVKTLTASHAASKPLWGAVLNKSNLGVKGATVILNNVTDKNITNISYGTTNAQGYYSFYPFIVYQTYRVKATKTINGVKHCSDTVSFQSSYGNGGNQIPTLILNKEGSAC